MKPTFIVGTGRCGSTMLSNIVNKHPDILSLSEFFTFLMDLGGRIPETFTPRKLSGEEFWNMISDIMPRESVMTKHDVTMPEMIYPYKDEKSKYSVTTGVPSILQVTLPHLTEKHDTIFEELKTFISSQNVMDLRKHYDVLFEWLKVKFNKEVWVERSGANFIYINELLNLYPEAKFIHIYRDGRNTAMSMNKHLGFSLFLIAIQIAEFLGVDPYESGNRDKIDSLPEDLKKFLPESFDREAFLNFVPPLSLCGQLWSDLIQQGLDTLSKISSDRILNISYEAFCENPKTHLKELASFVGVEYSLAWEKEVLKNIKVSPKSWLDLPLQEREALEKACEPGMTALEKIRATVLDKV